MTEEFHTALIFQDGMVLQRDKEVFVWGYGPEGEEVSVCIQNRRASAVVKEGKWKVKLPPLTASESEILEISCEKRKITIKDAAVGEVWIAGGQSNMEFFLRYDIDAGSILKRDENRSIRFFDFPEIAYPGQISEKDYSQYGRWRICTPSQLEYFSAVGYHFASRIQEDLSVPVGIVGCNWGGTPACAWMATEYIENNEGRIWLDEYGEALEGLDTDRYYREYRKDPGNYRNDIFSDKTGEAMMFGMSLKEQRAFMNSPDFSEESLTGPLDKCRPGGLFESMVMEAAPYTARGVLWYQGESDDKHPEIYRVLLSSLIQCWRDAWQDDLPFLIVQLAPFRRWLHCSGGQYPVIREEQEWVARHVPGTWLACIMDSGEEWDIHPRKKKPVGVRLAILAEGRIYGKEILCESPVLKGYRLEPGKLALSFHHAPGGLNLTGDLHRIKALELKVEGCAVPDFASEFEESDLILLHECLQPGSIVEVAYAKMDFCEVNLYNTAGLPVRPFALAIGKQG